MILSPFTTTLMLDLVRDNISHRKISTFDYTCTAPVYCNQPLILNGKLNDDTCTVWATDASESIVFKGTATLTSMY